MVDKNHGIFIHRDRMFSSPKSIFSKLLNRQAVQFVHPQQYSLVIFLAIDGKSPANQQKMTMSLRRSYSFWFIVLHSQRVCTEPDAWQRSAAASWGSQLTTETAPVRPLLECTRLGPMEISGSLNGGTVPYKAIFCGDIPQNIALKKRLYI